MLLIGTQVMVKALKCYWKNSNKNCCHIILQMGEGNMSAFQYIWIFISYFLSPIGIGTEVKCRNEETLQISDYWVSTINRDTSISSHIKSHRVKSTSLWRVFKTLPWWQIRHTVWNGFHNIGQNFVSLIIKLKTQINFFDS